MVQKQFNRKNDNIGEKSPISGQISGCLDSFSSFFPLIKIRTTSTTTEDHFSFSWRFSSFQERTCSMHSCRRPLGRLHVHERRLPNKSVDWIGLQQAAIICWWHCYEKHFHSLDKSVVMGLITTSILAINLCCRTPSLTAFFIVCIFLSFHYIRVMFDINGKLYRKMALFWLPQVLSWRKTQTKADWLTLLRTRCAVQSEVSWRNRLNRFPTELNGTG